MQVSGNTSRRASPMSESAAETGIVIGYSRWKAAGFLLLYAGLASMCVYGLVHRKWLVVIGLPIFGWGIVVRGRELLNRQPQLRLNEQGIQLEDEPLDSWRIVSNPEIQTEQVGRRSLVYLRYQAGHQQREIEISDLDIEPELLEVWLAEYRAAHEAAVAAGAV